MRSKKSRDTLCAIVFDIQQPINKLEELEQVANMANNTYTGAQLVNIGIKLIKNLNDFLWLTITYLILKLTSSVSIKSKTELVVSPCKVLHIINRQVNTITGVLAEMKHEHYQILSEAMEIEEKVVKAMQLSRDNVKGDENFYREYCWM